MDFQIFYSWQNDNEPKFNNNLIQRAIKAAIERLKILNLDFHFRPILDRAGEKKQAGSPNIVSTINKKIRSCDIFVADITYVTTYELPASGKTPARRKGAINSNVAIELGQAKSLLGDERVIKVMNAAFGSPQTAELPFDIEQDRHPISYFANDEQSAKTASKKLEDILFDAFTNILAQHDTLQKERYKPFLTAGRWAYLIDRSVSYFKNANLQEKMTHLQKQAMAPRSVVRISGLSGIGKSRFVFESLVSAQSGSTKTTSFVLYYDADSQAENNISEKISEITAEGESFVFVVDNVPSDLHSRLSKVVLRISSMSSLITIAPEVEDPLAVGEIVSHIRIETLLGEQIALSILRARFGSADFIALRQAIQAVGGLPSLAVMLAKHTELDINQLSQQTSTNWVNSVLGSQANETNVRSVLRAVSAFGLVGFQAELESECKLIAFGDHITPLENVSESQRWIKFKRIVLIYIEKGIIGKKGRYIYVKPQHLALQLAREWWQNQGSELADILQSVVGTPLSVTLFDQMRYLSRLPQAQELVASLFSFQGALGKASVVLSKDGAKFVQSLADVNPYEVATCLARELLPMSLSSLHQASDGRRSLVWALEKLCRFENTFDNASRVLLHLAAAENEQITNNATAQFTQLFQFQLAGTEANYEQRLNTLDYAKARDDVAFDRLIIAACARALQPARISRMTFESEQLQLWKEYEPDNNEPLWDYWEKALNILMSYAENIASPQQAEVAVLIVGIMPGIIPFFDLNPFLSSIQSLVTAKLIPFKIVHETVRSARYFNDGRLGEPEIQFLMNLEQQTLPVTLEDRIDRYVFDFPSAVDSDQLGVEALEERVKGLVADFLAHPEIWEQTAATAYGKNPFHTTVFFKEVATQLTGSQNNSNVFLHYLLESMKNHSSGSYSTKNPLVGFLEGAGQPFRDSTLRKMITIPQLNHLVFLFTAQSSPGQELLEELLTNVEKGLLPVAGVGSLRYSKIITQLTDEKFESLIERIAAINTVGKWVALSLILDGNHQGENWSNITEKLLLTPDLWTIEVDPLLEHQTLIRLTDILDRTVDRDTIDKATRQLLTYAVTPRQWRTNDNAKMPFKILLQKHFDIAWPIVADFLSSGTGNLIFDLLGASTKMRATDGGQYEKTGLLLQYGDNDQILDWCATQQLSTLEYFASKLPIFDPANKQAWHPFTLRFIDHFGSYDSLLHAISNRMHTYGSSSSVEAMYKSYIRLFENLSSHLISGVHLWALNRIQYLNLLADSERMFMDEMNL